MIRYEATNPERLQTLPWIDQQQMRNLIDDHYRRQKATSKGAAKSLKESEQPSNGS